MIQERHIAGHRVALDTTGQVLGLDASANAPGQGPLVASVAATMKPGGLLPASVLAVKARKFEDGLLAAVELSCQPAKARMLETLLAAIRGNEGPGVSEADALLRSARRMGSAVPLNADPAIEERCRTLMSLFLADPERSEPTGYFGWHPSLESIYRQDRFLSAPMARNAAEVLARELRQGPPAVRSTYEGTLRLRSLLANQSPDGRIDLRLVQPGGPEGQAPMFLPWPRSFAEEMAFKIFGDPEVPGGLDMLATTISAIRSNQLRAKVGPGTGRYEYELSVLESLLVPESTPEARGLEYSAHYREMLERLFLALADLSGNQSLPLPTTATAMVTPWKAKVEVRPELTIEPLFSFYWRRAQSYGYLRKVLESFFGAGLGTLRRFSTEETVVEPLGVELNKMESLFFGAADVVARELGLPLPERPTSEQDMFWVKHWASELDRDPDLGLDDRHMVPVSFDAKRNKINVLAHAGYKVIPLTVTYARPPRIAVQDSAGQRITDGVELRHSVYEIMLPVVLPVSVDELHEPGAFRALCDEAGTEHEIAARIGGF